MSEWVSEFWLARFAAFWLTANLGRRGAVEKRGCQVSELVSSWMSEWASGWVSEFWRRLLGHNLDRFAALWFTAKSSPGSVIEIGVSWVNERVSEWMSEWVSFGAVYLDQILTAVVHFFFSSAYLIFLPRIFRLMKYPLFAWCESLEGGCMEIGEKALSGIT